MANDKLEIKIQLQGEQYQLRNTSFIIDSSGSVLMGGATITDEDKKKLVELQLRYAIKKVADQMADYMAKEIHKVYSAEIKQATKKFIDDNKEALLAKVMEEVAKDATTALERLYTEERKW